MSQAEKSAAGFRQIEHCWIPLSDGTRLAARIWVPNDADEIPVPAIFEFIPYRKRDFYRETDESIHPYFASHGYAVVRADLRGTGESDGILLDEYLSQEQDDAVEAIAWIASQSWCSGAVGMMGISWGGFNALQVVARRPPALKAIITVASTDDRYADDIHYMGGCLINDNIAWAAQMFLRNARPPDPALVGESWRNTWLDRLERTPPYLPTWLLHQTRDAYWQHGSVCEDFSAISAAVWAIGGWADSYLNAVPRLVAGLQSPVKGLVGPWPHEYPHRATPGPRLGFLQMAVDWWDRWLKGKRNAVDRWPTYAAYIQSSVRPSTFYPFREGRWIAETSWPTRNVEPLGFHLSAEGRLTTARAGSGAVSIASPLTTGLGYRRWCPYGLGPEMASDQRGDDAGSAVFDSDPLSEPIEILGAAEVTLDAASDRPVAMIAARLADVAPDGSATLVSYGLLNLCHREGHDRVIFLEPGDPVRVTVRLNHIGYRFPAGHRVRLSLSSNYWPIAWPSPQPVRLTILTGSARLDLPRYTGREQPLPFAYKPMQIEGLRRQIYRPAGYNRTITSDMAEDKVTVVATKDAGHWFAPDTGLECDGITTERYALQTTDPLSAEVEVSSFNALARELWRVELRTRTLVRCTEREFILDLDLDASEDRRRVFHRSWNFTVPRNGV
jgi:putative CocE/NonD family hydrolase